MARNCLNHSNQPSVTMCHQYHKPICKSCVMVTPHGTFCSSECSIIFREFKDKMKAGGPGKSTAGKQVVFVLLLAILVVFGIHFAVRFGNVKVAEKFDLLGNFIGYYKPSPK